MHIVSENIVIPSETGGSINLPTKSLLAAQNYSYPLNYWGTPTYYPPPPEPTYKIRRVANGFIVSCGYGAGEYVAKNLDGVQKILDELENKK